MDQAFRSTIRLVSDWITLEYSILTASSGDYPAGTWGPGKPFKVAPYKLNKLYMSSWYITTEKYGVENMSLTPNIVKKLKSNLCVNTGCLLPYSHFLVIWVYTHGNATHKALFFFFDWNISTSLILLDTVCDSLEHFWAVSSSIKLVNIFSIKKWVLLMNLWECSTMNTVAIIRTYSIAGLGYS